MTIAELIQSAAHSWAPPPKQKVSEWAESNFVLSPEYSAKTGNLHLFKFQREPLDCIGDPFVREQVIMSATQMLKTLTLQVGIAYAIAADPGPILLAQPTETDAETFSKERLTPMIRDMECLRSRVAPEKKTSTSNTVLHKTFKGGSLSLIGAQTAGNFARRSIRYFFADERDKWKKNVGKEGDGFSLGVKRTATFRSRAKVIQVCSPTIKGDSAIDEAYERSDKRRFYVPCLACGHLQPLAWANVKWTGGDSATAFYCCSNCGAGWSDAQRHAACEANAAAWIAEKPFDGVAGFWISELYSPWKSLSELVADFLSKKDSPETLQTFVNTTLAEPWQQAGDAPEWERLAAHAEDYVLGEIPSGVRFITAGVDVQKDRVEVAKWGWGRNRKRWLVDYTIIRGELSEQATKDRLTEELNVTHQTEMGVDLPVAKMAIDSGYAAEEVYSWARQQGPGRVLVVKGDNRQNVLLGSPLVAETTSRGKKSKWGIRIWPVGVSHAKSELYGQLRLNRSEDVGETPAGWVAIPARGWTDPTAEEFCRQMVAEQYIVRVVKGYKRGEWVKARERNEALDTANYARAAAEYMGVSRWAEKDWERLDAQFGLVPAAPPAAKAGHTAAPQEKVMPTGVLPPRGLAIDRGQRKGWFSR